MKNKKKFVSILLAVLIVLGTAGTVLGAGNYITRKLWQGPITMYRNSQQVQLGVHPIIMDGTTYVPVRAMAQLMGMNITWDNASRSIFISDNSQANMAYYAQLVAANEAQMKELKSQIEKLEKEKKDLQTKLDEANKKLDDRRDGYGNLTELERQLNRYAGRATIDGQDLTFDYTVRESSYNRTTRRYDLTVTVEVRGNTKNSSLRNSYEFIRFLEGYVVNEVRRYGRSSSYDYYDRFDIDVIDREYRQNNCSFYVDSNGTVRER